MRTDSEHNRDSPEGAHLESSYSAHTHTYARALTHPAPAGRA